MRINPRKTQLMARIVIWSAAIIVLVILFSIIIYILSKGIPHITWQFLTQIPSDMGRSGGISSAIVGTLAVTLVAIVVATPFGVGTAFYLTEYTRESVITKIVRFSAESLAGIPSIVYGLLALYSL